MAHAVSRCGMKQDQTVHQATDLEANRSNIPRHAIDEYVGNLAPIEQGL
jgi:hypothetical protein